MKVLITGSSGFIGAAVTRAVVSQGDEVRALCRPASNRRNLDGIPVEIVEGDLRDPDSLKQAVRGCQGIYHVAGSLCVVGSKPRDFL